MGQDFALGKAVRFLMIEFEQRMLEAKNAVPLKPPLGAQNPANWRGIFLLDKIKLLIGR
jgi:hypothetical protein